MMASMKLSSLGIGRTPLLALVPPPAHLVRAALGTADYVEPLVAVEFGGNHRVGAGPAILEHSHRPGFLRVAGVLQPDDAAAAAAAPGRGDDVELAVAVEVRRDRLERARQLRQHVLLPCRAVAGLADVLVPNDLSRLRPRVEAERHNDVEVAIAVEINRVAMRGPRRLVIDDVLLPRLANLAGVLVPDDRIRGRDGAEEVDLAVAVEIAGADGARLAAGLLVDLVARPELAIERFAVVAEPGELLANPTRCCHIELAVAIKVGQGDVV